MITTTKANSLSIIRLETMYLVLNLRDLEQSHSDTWIKDTQNLNLSIHNHTTRDKDCKIWVNLTREETSDHITNTYTLLTAHIWTYWTCKRQMQYLLWCKQSHVIRTIHSTQRITTYRQLICQSQWLHSRLVRWYTIKHLLPLPNDMHVQSIACSHLKPRWKQSPMQINLESKTLL